MMVVFNSICTVTISNLVKISIHTPWYNENMSLKDPKNQKLINDFLVEHAPLIHKHINILKSKGLVPSNIDESDLHFAGFHGLVDALHKYDHNVATRTSSKPDENLFSKYAERRIQGKMLDHIASQDHIPKSLRIKAKNLDAMREQTTSTQPSPQDPVAKTPVPEE